jgi:hypothetical protein
MRTFIAAAALLFSVPAVAQIADTYVIPVAGHSTGANGETWVTDLTLHNVSDSPLMVELEGIGPDGEPMDLTTGTATIPPRGSTQLRDVVLPSGVGSLLITGDGEFAMTSRVFTEHAAGSVGSVVPAVDSFIDLENGGAFVPGLAANSSYRTNIGFFAVAGTTPLHFAIDLLDGSGATLATKAFAVPAGTMTHRQISSREIAAIDFDAAAAQVRVTDGDGVITAYASVVDNRSRDASFVAAQALSELSAASLLRHRSLLRERFGKEDR